jgi:Arc/MetJ family transcription regulator
MRVPAGITSLYNVNALWYNAPVSKPTQIRLSDEGQRICAAARKKFGLSSVSAVVEMALRLLAEKEKLK